MILVAAETAALLAARARRRPCRPLEPPCVGSFTDGMEVLKDGTVLHLASFCLTDAELRLEGAEDPAFAELKVRYADVLGAPADMPPERGMELELETGDVPMPRPLPVKRLLDGELSELRSQLIDLLEPGWIQHLTAGHTAAVVFLRKPGPQRHHGVEPLPHIDALLDCTRGSRVFTKLDLASSDHPPARVRTSDRRQTSFRSQLGKFELNVVPFGLRGASSLLMRIISQALKVCLDFPRGPTPTPAIATAAACSDTAAPSSFPHDRPGQPLPPICGRLLRGRGTADGTRQPEGAVRVDPGGAGKLRRPEAGPLVGAVLRTFDPTRRAVPTTDASNVAVAAILTQPDDEGHQHPVAYESRKLTAAERNYPAHVLELLAVVHALRAFRHYLRGGGAPRPGDCWSDFDLRTDNQAITWLKTNRHLNKMYVRWLDEIEDFRFDVTHLPGSRNPSDPLSRRGFPDGDGPAVSTGDPAAESQQELFSRLGRDASAHAPAVGPPAGALWLDAVEAAPERSGAARVPSMLATVRARWAAIRHEAAAMFANTQEGGAIPSTLALGGWAYPPSVLLCSSR